MLPLLCDDSYAIHTNITTTKIDDTYGDDVRGDNGGDEHGVDKVIDEMANMEVDKVADLV